MYDLLFDYYLTVFEVIVIFFLIGGAGAFLIGGAGAFAYWGLSKRWQKGMEALERELAEVRLKYDRAYFMKLYDHLHSAVAHEFVKGLDFISKKSKETLEGLKGEQASLRDKQSGIIAKANELIQHATNILGLFALEEEKPQLELLSIRQVIEDVLNELFPYAQGKGVILRPDLTDPEPISLNRNFALQVLKNVIHNAIKYSYRGGVVDITLYYDEGETEQGAERQKVVCVTVRDRGKGIEKRDHDGLFELKKRGDGLIEPGSGLGLHYARKLARLHGGDVVLVESGVNRGSTFNSTLAIFPTPLHVVLFAKMPQYMVPQWCERATKRVAS